MKTEEKRNHVVKQNSYYGNWGRGETIKEALQNAGLNPKYVSFTHYHFKNNNWDIFTDGRITWEEGNLISQKSYDKAELKIANFKIA